MSLGSIYLWEVGSLNFDDFLFVIRRKLWMSHHEFEIDKWSQSFSLVCQKVVSGTFVKLFLMFQKSIGTENREFSFQWHYRGFVWSLSPKVTKNPKNSYNRVPKIFYFQCPSWKLTMWHQKKLETKLKFLWLKMFKVKIYSCNHTLSALFPEFKVSNENIQQH